MKHALLILAIGAIAVDAALFVVAPRQPWLVLSHLLAMLGMLFIAFGYVFPIGMAARSAGPSRVADVESGQRLAFVRCGGIVGDVNMTSPLLAVAVYPTGIVLRALFMRPMSVLMSEISGLVARRVMLAARFEISHTSTELASPVVLYLRAQSEVAKAIASTARVPVLDGAGTASEESPLDPSRANLRMASAVLGTAMGTVFVILGIVQVIPAFAPFGIAWTLGSAYIALYNARYLLRRR